MLSATRSNLLIIGMVAMQTKSAEICDANSVANAYGIRLVTVLKELVTLEACGFLVKQYTPPPLMRASSQYNVTDEGYRFLTDNKPLYVKAHMAIILGESNWT